MNVLSIDIGGTAVKSAIITPAGTIENYKKTVYSDHPNNNMVLGIIESLVEEYRDYGRIGISTTGYVLPDGSIGYASNNITNYAGTRIKDILEKKQKLPVTVVRDSIAMAYGEINYGAGKDYTDFICLTYGSGIGGAIVINGKPYLGANGNAGQFGHIILHPGGRKCFCGSQGCYEAYAVNKVLEENVRIKLGQEITGQKIFDLMRKGDKNISILVEEWIREVSMGIVTIIHSIDPLCVVLGGGVMEELGILDKIKKNVYDMVIDVSRNFELRIAIKGNAVNLLGSAYCAKNWSLHQNV
jgi:predicted NBD/HSP70 family sugar kinase